MGRGGSLWSSGCASFPLLMNDPDPRVLSLLCLDRASTQEPGQRSKILEACSSQGDAEALLAGELGGREAHLPGHPLSSQAGLRGGQVVVEVP